LKLRVDSLAPLVQPAGKDYKTSFDRTDREAQKFYFNPNTISHDSLLLLGFSDKQAASIISYRSHGGFKTTEQFLRLNVVSNHQHLSGYVRMTQEVRTSFKTEYDNAKIDTASTLRHFASASAIKPIDINTADTAELKTLSGIGNYLAQQIVEYRQKLGGYTHLEQLCEIKYFDRDKLLRLQNRLTIDHSRVKKIPLTKEGAEMLRFHPYAGAYIARGIAQQIKYSNSTTTIDDLVKNNILSPEQADKLRDYIMD
jgi:competence ComEA-like helix-hairpin-helix protein